jgi:hypothetical protein
MCGWHLPVEAETRPRDIQSLERRLALKLRDAEATECLLVFSETRHNHEFVRLAGEGLLARFPIPARTALGRLGKGLHPGGGAILFL